MINAKRIAQLATKRMAALGRKLLTWGITKESDECRSSLASKGHCMVYTANGRRFEILMDDLGTTVFVKLLQISQEFGFTYNGWITPPCDATVVEYAMCLLMRSGSAGVKKAFMNTMGV